ncbi:MAG: ATP-binding protein, partial [Clostridiales Family XIII bacterium]|nr:ATP-binding protein [Clostridiales Family XIII bacterium]
TLLRHAFPDYRHVNLEEKDIRDFAIEDPRGFLNGFGDYIVIDEAQYAPDLLSYIQPIVDARNDPGLFILSGSQNFLLLKSISQSLAGRVGILSLLPFSFHECEAGGISVSDTNLLMIDGSYPRLVTRRLKPTDFYPNYIKTYVERDVRMETGVQDLNKFTSFMHICAQSAGTPVNLAAIGTAADADARTVTSWLNILEESYIIFRLKPYTRKIAPRYSKKPKLYFYDTGLLCSLLGIKNTEAMQRRNLRGLIFENMIVTDYRKQVFNHGGFPADNTYFWRDGSSRDKEVDLIVEGADKLELYEIKSAETAKNKHADNLFLFEKNAENTNCIKHVVYDGPNSFTKNGVTYLNRRDFANADDAG